MKNESEEVKLSINGTKYTLLLEKMKTGRVMMWHGSVINPPLPELDKKLQHKVKKQLVHDLEAKIQSILHKRTQAVAESAPKYEETKEEFKDFLKKLVSQPKKQ